LVSGDAAVILYKIDRVFKTICTLSKHLFILPRRGLFQTTICSQCGHVFRSPESDVNLVTIRSASGYKEMIDYTTQKIYPFPTDCPECHNTELVSLYSGAEDLAEKLEEQLHTKVARHFDTKHISTPTSTTPYIAEYHTYSGELTISTRLYDPSIDYTLYDTVVIAQAENFTASADYLVLEEVYKQLYTLLLTLTPKQQLIIDTGTLESPLIGSIVNAQVDLPASYEAFLEQETKQRKQFGLPPDYSLILITSQERKKDQALAKIQQARTLLKKYEHLGITVSSPYPAKLLRRKNFYSYHVSLKLDRKNQAFAKLRIIILDLAKQLNLQVRLNPKHLF
jgi:primosomal protein N' (replication factor Y) (superfamily II helicase)